MLWNSTAFAFTGQNLRGEFLQRIFLRQLITRLWSHCPLRYLIQPVRQVFLGIAAFIYIRGSDQITQLRRPLKPGITHGLDPANNRFMPLQQCFVGQWPALKTGQCQMRPDFTQQTLRPAPVLQQCLRQQRIGLPGDLSPVIGHRHRAQICLFGEKFVIKQTAGFKSILGQHALAKTVDGIDGRFIHLPLRRQ